MSKRTITLLVIALVAYLVVTKKVKVPGLSS
jgi:hypothetical protein